MDLPWMLHGVILPFAATFWWVWYADIVKSRNPMAWFLGSANLQDFNLGTLATRISPELWRMKWRICVEEVTWWPVLLFGAGVLLLGARHRAREATLAATMQLK